MTPADAIDRMACDNLKRPSELGIRISPEFEQTVMHGLTLHAADRCQSMDNLLKSISREAPGNTEHTDTADADATLFADQTYILSQTTETIQPEIYSPDNWDNRKVPQKAKKKNFLIPAILGGVVFIATAFFIIWNVIGNGDKKVDTSGDYYVTGCKESLKLHKTEDVDSKVLTKLNNKEKVGLIERTENDFWKVYVEAEDLVGYLDYHYLTNERDAAMEPIDKYVNVKSDEQLTILSTSEENATSIGILNRANQVTVLAMPGDTYAYIYAPDANAYGYVDRKKLSEKEPTEEKGSSEDNDNKATEQPQDTGTPPSEKTDVSGSISVQQNIYEPILDIAPDFEVLIKNVDSGLNVRSQPTHNSELVCTINDKTNLLYYGEWAYGLGSDNKTHIWCKVYNISTPGWVRSDYVMRLELYYHKNTSSSLNLRAMPQHNSNLVISVSDNRPLYFYGEVKQGYGSDGVIHDWYKVYLGDGITGWARSDLLAEGNQYG